MKDALFLGEGAVTSYRQAIAGAAATIGRSYAGKARVYDGKPPAELIAMMAAIDPLPERAMPLREVLAEVERAVVQHSVSVHHPAYIAHLHCPPMIPALAAEVVISATNQSMDSFDQSPAATYLEQRLVDWLCASYGLGAEADGVFTSGGTQSNLMGLMLARDHFARTRFGWNIQQDGLPPEASRFRILASEISHFSVRQSASLLGLGAQAVHPVPCSRDGIMTAADVERAVFALNRDGLIPIAVVATAGTTDFGTVDPIHAISQIARGRGLWLHVDAAYGGALMFSERERAKLSGIELADSVTVDFHKLFFQPISCGAFLLKDKKRFELMRLNADYLNPESNEAEVLDLVGKSLQTTRRFDGLKLLVSLQTVGRRRFAAMIEGTIDLARRTADFLAGTGDFEVANPKPALNAVVFRYAPVGHNPEDLDRLNLEARRRLFDQGIASLAQTKVDGRIYLKFTLLNPLTTDAHIATIIDAIRTHP
jgi:L-2,4-diaminobutyrate decarboxylase